MCSVNWNAGAGMLPEPLAAVSTEYGMSLRTRTGPVS